MTPAVHAFAVSALARADVEGKRVLEAGAYDVNGSVRPYIESLNPASYTGIDMRAGPRVDLVMDAADIPAVLGHGCADVVICCEMLEHAVDWQAAMRGLIGALAPGGLLVLTVPSPGFPYHGYPDDHHRFTPDAMGQVLKAAGLDVLRCEANPDPGVFAKARKPGGWTWPDGTRDAWDQIEVGRP